MKNSFSILCLLELASVVNTWNIYLYDLQRNWKKTNISLIFQTTKKLALYVTSFCPWLRISRFIFVAARISGNRLLVLPYTTYCCHMPNWSFLRLLVSAVHYLSVTYSALEKNYTIIFLSGFGQFCMGRDHSSLAILTEHLCEYKLDLFIWYYPTKICQHTPYSRNRISYRSHNLITKWSKSSKHRQAVELTEEIGSVGHWAMNIITGRRECDVEHILCFWVS